MPTVYRFLEITTRKEAEEKEATEQEPTRSQQHDLKYPNSATCSRKKGITTPRSMRGYLKSYPRSTTTEAHNGDWVIDML